MAEQTQVLRPVPAAEPAQQPPHFDQYGGYEAQQPSPPQDDFAHLYRQDGAPAQQQPQQFQQPQFQQPQFQQPQAPPWQQQPAQPHEYAPQQPHEAGPGRKKLSPAAVVGIVVACCALAGLAAGAVMSGGGHDTQGSSGSSPSAAASSSASTSSGDAGGAKGQAEKLDALLKQSGSSRASVISAVSGIQACQNLGQAATDLRAAATQRKGLVASLGSLPVDQLPDHQALTEALTNAWNASASADTHYAAWADQAANQNKVCKNGRARSTAQRTAGDQSSVAATAQKKRAVSLWNSIAVQYGLKKYQASEL
jgi:hypothetical protein